jgi:hypothetical protein
MTATGGRAARTLGRSASAGRSVEPAVPPKRDPTSEVTMAWTLLVIAGLLETGWAIGLKYSEGFTRPGPRC